MSASTCDLAETARRAAGAIGPAYYIDGTPMDALLIALADALKESKAEAATLRVDIERERAHGPSTRAIVQTMKRRRSDGTGTKERLPSGKVRVRVRIDGAREDHIFDDEEAADSYLRGAQDLLASGTLRSSAPTLATWGKAWTDSLVNRSADDDRSRWRSLIAPAPIAQLEELARAVLDARPVRLAREVLRGGEWQLAAGLDLAGEVLRRAAGAGRGRQVG